MAEKNKNKNEVKTTGHSFDGIEEYDNQIPTWWKIAFIICIIVAIAYALIFPSFPYHKGNFAGLLNWTSKQKLEKDLNETSISRKQQYEKLKTLSFDEIRKDANLKEFAIKGASYFFQDNCVPCHGKGGAGQKGGFPVLVDDDWIWGGKIEQIYQTINYGIRNSNPNSRQNAMTKFGVDGILNKDQIDDVADYVFSLSNKNYQAAALKIQSGKEIFAKNCISCHGVNAKGNKELGAPNLTDKIWIYGGEKKDIVAQVYSPKMGAMPAWGERLDPEIIKMLTIYVYELGGGEK